MRKVHSGEKKAAHFRERVSFQEIERRSASLQASAEARAADAPQGSPAEVAAAMAAMVQQRVEEQKAAEGASTTQQGLSLPPGKKARGGLKQSSSSPMPSLPESPKLPAEPSSSGAEGSRHSEESSPPPATAGTKQKQRLQHETQESSSTPQAGAPPAAAVSPSVSREGSLPQSPGRQQKMGGGASASYQRLSASEDAPSLGSARQASPSTCNADGSLPLLGRAECGEQRKHLRDNYNIREILLLRLLKRYFATRSAAAGLSVEELRALLAEWDGEPASRADVRYVLLLASDQLQPAQMLPANFDRALAACRALHALRHLPAETGAICARNRIREGPQPSGEAVHAVLKILNEQLPVSDTEVAYVRRTIAVCAGGSERHVGLEHVRMGLAAWYLQIERDETSQQLLLRQSVMEIAQIVERTTSQGSQAMPPAPDRLASGSGHPLLPPAEAGASESDYSFGGFSPAMRQTQNAFAFGLMLIAIPVVLWSLYLLHFAIVANHGCQHNLNVLLGWSGFLNILCCLGIGALAMKVQIGTKLVLPLLVGACILLNIMLGFVGVIFTMSSSREVCGPVTWDTAHFAYIQLPSLLGLLVCCAPLLTLVFAIGATFMSARASDHELMEVETLDP